MAILLLVGTAPIKSLCLIIFILANSGNELVPHFWSLAKLLLWLWGCRKLDSKPRTKAKTHSNRNQAALCVDADAAADADVDIIRMSLIREERASSRSNNTSTSTPTSKSAYYDVAI